MKGTVYQNCNIKKCRFPAPVQSGSGSKGLSQEIFSKTATPNEDISIYNNWKKCQTK